jgi:hypothetical protein
MPATKTYIRGTCKKCGIIIRVEMKDALDTLKQELSEPFPYECPGRHQEFGPMLSGYDWDWTPMQAEEPQLPSDEEYGRQLIEKHGKERVFYLGDPAIGEALGIKHLTTLKDLEHLGFGDFANAQHYYVRHDSPRHTTRFYIGERR